MRNFFTKTTAAALALATLTLGIALESKADELSLNSPSSTEVANPIEGVGYSFQTITFRANGVSEDPSSFQFVNIVGYPASCNGSTCSLGSPSACQSDPNIFNRSSQRQQDDLDFFVEDSWERFGVNIADPNLYLLLPYAARADVGIMAVMMSGVDVPPEGYYVDDCGMQAVALAPGYPNLVVGSYRIDVDSEDAEVILNYRLERDLDALSDFRTLGNYLIADETGVYGDGLEGHAQFVTTSTCDGTVNASRQCSGVTSHNIWNSIWWNQEN